MESPASDPCRPRLFKSAQSRITPPLSGGLLACRGESGFPAISSRKAVKGNLTAINCRIWPFNGLEKRLNAFGSFAKMAAAATMGDVSKNQTVGKSVLSGSSLSVRFELRAAIESRSRPTGRWEKPGGRGFDRFWGADRGVPERVTVRESAGSGSKGNSQSEFEAARGILPVVD